MLRTVSIGIYRRTVHSWKLGPTKKIQNTVHV